MGSRLNRLTQPLVREDGKLREATWDEAFDGGSGGIGGACVRLFAAEGAEVIVHYHRGRERAETAGGSTVVSADLTNEADVRRLFAEAGPLDVCAAIAGVWPAGDVPVWELPLERWRATVDEPDGDVPHRPRLPGATRRP